MAYRREPLRGGSAQPPRFRTRRTDNSSRTPARGPKNDHRARNALIVLLAIAAIAFGVGWNPPHDKTHTFSSASDYNSTKESGCTNSGSGCHGSEVSYQDFNTYHPDTQCGVCHSWQGVACIPCHAPNKNHECPLCHDGSMKRAPDVVRITDNYPNGHYRETTHTAMGDDYGSAMRAEPTGKASATCADCHSRDLRKAHTAVAVIAGSTYGTDIGCGECHNDVRSFGQAEVVANWKTRTCEACHKVGSSTPMHPTKLAGAAKATDSPGCADSGSGCHEGEDLHLSHVDLPKRCSGSAAKGEPSCHKLGTEALAPTATSCGGTADSSCHRAGTSGSYQHDDSDAHSPTDDTAASAVFDGVPCGSCHYMAADGKSLTTEHTQPTSAMTLVPDNECQNCHNSPASADAIDDEWAARDTADACQACHGHAGLAGVHDADVSEEHTVGGSEGCASSGPGCHPTSNLASSGLHSTCLHCHDRTGAGANGPYDPDKGTCGTGRDCHNRFDPETSAHKGARGTDDLHEAGVEQRRANYRDLKTGVDTPCGSCHDMTLGTEHTRPSVKDPWKNSCTGCHNTEPSPSVVKSGWPDRDTDSACAACHETSGAGGMHDKIDTAHVATELGTDGLPAPGSCLKSGCHSSNDLRQLHASAGCAVTGCHSSKGSISGRDLKSCGGLNEISGCHAGFSATNHFVSHAADLLGTVKDVEYVVGANAGCFGCHTPDLNSEHNRELAAGGMEGVAVNSCRVCHYDPLDPGSGTYSADSDVKSAIDRHDMRCTACHSSGTSADTAESVASPHKNITTQNPLPDGKVWSDPFNDWKTALNATTGGGHNSLSADLVGASSDRRFPLTSFTIGGQPYSWDLPPNSGSTTWLKAEALPGQDVEGTSAIQRVKVTCADCHAMPENMAGPHGASVHMGIDPAYSQTEYANPTDDAYQFSATGTDRVVCMKCHNMEAGTTDPGGAPLHTRHVRHDDLPPSNVHHYGEKCIDCHVRIPHAWKRPRLLVRTVETTDGAAPDVFPYVPEDYEGLAGIVLQSYSTSSELRSRYCATGGCHPGHSSTRHPLPSEIPTAAYWP